jgi:hypothetical protein
LNSRRFMSRRLNVAHIWAWYFSIFCHFVKIIILEILLTVL